MASIGTKNKLFYKNIWENHLEALSLQPILKDIIVSFK